MTHNQNSSHRNRLLVAVMLCGMALTALCGCAKETQTPPVQPVSTSTPPPAPVANTTQPAAVTPPSPEVAVATPHVSAHDLPNFHAVTPTLFRGAAPTSQGLEDLQKMGIKTIIDLRIAPKTVAKEHTQLDRMGVHFINLPMGGDQPPTDKQIETFLTTLADPAQQPVFVHCQHGADRTGTMIGIYRERVDGWAYDKTYKEMLKYGFDPRWTKLSDTARRYAPTGTAH